MSMARPEFDCTGIPKNGPESRQARQIFTSLQDLGALTKSLAPITSADLFKSQVALQKPRSTFDASDFWSHEARHRQPSSLKAGSAGLEVSVVNLSTGRPSPDLFPIERLSLEFTDVRHATQSRSEVKHFEAPKKSALNEASLVRNDPSSTIDLSIALSYGYSLGHEQMIQFLTTHISYYHSPPYSDWEVCLTVGNTSALDMAFRNFASPGDCILVENCTYSGAIEAAKPLELSLVPINMDEHGLCPESLEKILLLWSVNHPEKPKPKIVYTIPTGQNPTGTTQPTARRLAVLDVVERYNLLLIEDDPYYYLQFPKRDRTDQYSLLPSYLSLCTTGRVLRLDTTSKILAPGFRLGWLTGPKAVVEVFQASHDLGVVHPSGLSQAVVYKLLSEVWGHAGLEQWLYNLADTYRLKAESIKCALQHFLGTGWLSEICSWTSIEAGMFVWLKIDCTSYPGLTDSALHEESAATMLSKIEHKIHVKALEKGMLCCKGSFFKVPSIRSTSSDGAAGEKSSEMVAASCGTSIHFRLTFATASAPDLARAVEALAIAVEESFGRS